MATPLYSITDVATAFELPISTLRFYDEIGLADATVRRARVRYYDDDALMRLAYVMLWRFDGMLSVEHTKVVAASGNSDDRNQIINHCRDEIQRRINRLTNALETLEHMTQCTRDNPVCCPEGRRKLRRTVDNALARLASAHLQQGEDGHPPSPTR